MFAGRAITDPKSGQAGASGFAFVHIIPFSGAPYLIVTVALHFYPSSDFPLNYACFK
jgi:hypothetical protein